jgi:hypothetical protein
MSFGEIGPGLESIRQKKVATDVPFEKIETRSRIGQAMRPTQRANDPFVYRVW